MNIILIGPRGSGKSTIGPKLAAAVGWSFVELDELALRQMGASSVREAWQEHGEPAWREAETGALVRAMTKRSQVLALGGGAPTVPAIESALQSARLERTVVVAYLHCRAETLQQRLAANPGDRPSLTGTDIAREVPAVLTAREPIYQRLADITCDTADGRPEAVVTALVKSLASRIA